MRELGISDFGLRIANCGFFRALSLSTLNHRGRVCSIVVLGLLSLARSSHAANISLDVSPRETIVGVPVELQITIQNASSHEPPTLPDIPDASVASNGPPSQQSRTTIINGVRDQSTTLVYSWSITPKRVGKIIIPPIMVQADGQSQMTQAVPVIVSKSDSGDLLIVELKGSRPTVYVGEQLDVTLQIFIKPFISKEMQFTMSCSDMLNRIDFRKCQWGAFQEAFEAIVNRRAAPSLSSVTRKDKTGQEHAFCLFELKRTFYPDRPGALDAGEVNIVMNYPASLGRSRDIFSAGQLSITQTKPMSATVLPSTTIVKPIPTLDRPALWNGAVGQYRLSVSAKPLEVSVGDPITLNLAISGTGRIETLQPPPLSQMSELTKNFKVPSDPVGGTVDGQTKRFSQSIRAICDTVTQIPAIPFAYFDPRTERFVTVQSEPIPIKVKPAQSLSMSQIIEAPGSANKPAAQGLVEVKGGILANYSDMDEVLGQQIYRPGWGTAAVLIAPPLLFVGAFITHRRREQLRSNSGLARRKTARRDALRRIHAAKTGDVQSIPSTVGEAISHYVADRFNLPPGGLTRDEVVRYLGQRRVGSELTARMDALLAECDAMRYAGENGSAGQKLADAAVEAIDALERTDA